MKVRLTVYRDVLVIETLNPDGGDYPGWSPHGPKSPLGCSIANTKASLGVSAEALVWLLGVGSSHEIFGDLDWVVAEDGTKTFSWMGGVYAVKLRGSVGSRNFAVHANDCIIIPNDTPMEARNAVEEVLSDFEEFGDDSTNFAWEDPAICGEFKFHLLGQEQCTLPPGHKSPHKYTEHDCPDCGVRHGVCAHCGTTHGDSHMPNCHNARPRR